MSVTIVSIWVVCGITAIMSLVKMMRNRQQHLIELLKKHVELHAAWQRRMERAQVLIAEAEAKTAKKNKLAKRAADIAEHVEA